MSNTEKMRAALAKKPLPQPAVGMRPTHGNPVTPATPETPPPDPVESKKLQDFLESKGAARIVAAEAAALKSPTPKKVKPSRAEKMDRRHGRLPHGSYVADTTLWRGSLTVTTADGLERFNDESSGQWTLMAKLDNQYRKWLADQQPAPAADSC